MCAYLVGVYTVVSPADWMSIEPRTILFATEVFFILINNSYIFVLCYNFLQEYRNVVNFAILLDLSYFYTDLNYGIVKP